MGKDGVPKSTTARGIIAISASFLVLLAASGPATATFLSNLVSSLITIAFGLLITVVFLEIAGVKVEDKHLFQKYGTIVGAGLVLLVILVFIGAGGLKIVGIPDINIGGDMMALLLFVLVVIAAVYVLYTEKDAKGKS